MRSATPGRIAVRATLAAAAAYGVLLLSLAHAYPWVSWSALSWAALRVFIGITLGAALLAVALVAWATAK